MTHSVLHLEPGNVKPLAFIYSLEQSLTYSPASSSKCAIIFLLKCFLFEFGSSGIPLPMFYCYVPNQLILLFLLFFFFFTFS